MPKENISEIAGALWKTQGKEQWERFAKGLKGSGLKYYRVVYANKRLTKAQDLTKSYVELYDAKQKLVTKAPLFEKRGAKVSGATYYLKGLLTINKVSEWIK